MARIFVKGAARRAGRGSASNTDAKAAGRRTEEKITIARRTGPNGRVNPGGRAVYYRQNSGEIVSVVPGARDSKFEQNLQGSIHHDRIYVTFTDGAAHPDTHRVIYQRGDIAVTPARREVLHSEHAAKCAHRRATQLADRHPKGRLREARADYRNAVVRLSRLSLKAARGSHRFRLLPEASKRLQSFWEAREYQRWFAVRVLSSDTPSAETWHQLLERGAPVTESLLTPLDFLPEVRWTKRQRRYARAAGFAGLLARYINSREGVWYREHILEAQRRHQPFLEPPGDDPNDRYPKYHRPYAENPAWRRRYAEWCVIRKAGLRLRRCRRCGRYFFMEQKARPRCPLHPPVNLKALNLLFGLTRTRPDE